MRHFLIAVFVFAVWSTEVRGEALSAEVQTLIHQAEAGDPDAQFRVATAYDSGQGAPRDGAEAMRWYRIAAERGHAEAQNSLGSGLQAAERYAEALPWYQQAANQDHALATNNLAYLYDLGLGTRQDRRKAFDLYTRAADLGWAEAMWNIANMYGAGQLGKKDMFMACVWTIRARTYSEPGGKVFDRTTRVFQHLQTQLSPTTFSECRDEAQAWMPTAKTISARPGVPVDAAASQPSPR